MFASLCPDLLNAYLHQSVCLMRRHWLGMHFLVQYFREMATSFTIVNTGQKGCLILYGMALSYSNFSKPWIYLLVMKTFMSDYLCSSLVIAHAGDGNFHTIILFDPSQDDQRKEAERLNHFMVHTALSMEGINSLLLVYRVNLLLLIRNNLPPWTTVWSRVISDRSHNICDLSFFFICFHSSHHQNLN